jgi:hypothetical protein
MQIKATSPEHYIDQLPEDRKQAITSLRKVILENLPAGFKETIGYGMIGYVIPHSIYPPGYHADPKLPVPFLNIASQKNYIAIYHMGLYSNKELLNWFTIEYSKQSKYKLDMGKGCVRFKRTHDIPYKLIGELASKITPAEWLKMYEKYRKK